MFMKFVHLFYNEFNHKKSLIFLVLDQSEMPQKSEKLWGKQNTVLYACDFNSSRMKWEDLKLKAGLGYAGNLEPARVPKTQFQTTTTTTK